MFVVVPAGLTVLAALGPPAFSGTLCLKTGGPGTRLDGQVLGHLFRGSGQSFKSILLAEVEVSARPAAVPEGTAAPEGVTELSVSDHTSLGIGLFFLLTDWSCTTHRLCWMGQGFSHAG